MRHKRGVRAIDRVPPNRGTRTKHDGARERWKRGIVQHTGGGA